MATANGASRKDEASRIQDKRGVTAAIGRLFMVVAFPLWSRRPEFVRSAIMRQWLQHYCRRIVFNLCAGR
jgi:hypothetical protein